MQNFRFQHPSPLSEIPASTLQSTNNVPENNLLSSNSQSSYVQFKKKAARTYFNISLEKMRVDSPRADKQSVQTPKNRTKTLVSHNANPSQNYHTKNGDASKRGGLTKVQDCDHKNSKKRFEFSKSKTRNLSTFRKENSSPTPRSKFTSRQKTNLPIQFKKENRMKPVIIKLQDFEFGKMLGKGKFGEVFLVRDKKTHFLSAMKIILKSTIREENFVDQFVKQLKIQTFLNHPNILKMYGFFSDSEKIYILIEYCSSGTLYDRICESPRLTQPQASVIVGQILTGLDELHYHQILHRDIKPQNILIQHGVVKIGDFGWSTHYETNQMRKTLCGTPIYISPQILTGEEYDEKIDIWSLGIVTYQLIVSKNPFKIKAENHLLRIIQQDIDLKQTTISSNAKDFILKTLNKNPILRWEASQLLNHAFIKPQ